MRATPISATSHLSAYLQRQGSARPGPTHHLSGSQTRLQPLLLVNGLADATVRPICRQQPTVDLSGLSHYKQDTSVAEGWEADIRTITSGD